MSNKDVDNKDVSDQEKGFNHTGRNRSVPKTYL
jgi:hypothetical protein